MNRGKAPFLPPRWFVRSFWWGHRLLYRITGRGLTRPVPGKSYGMLRLRTKGRRSGEQRAVILAYHMEGEDFITLAMNGWAEADPAWWLNLQAHPDADADTVDGVVSVRGREAVGAERDRLWSKLKEYGGWGDIDSHSVRRSHTPVVVLERTSVR